MEDLNTVLRIVENFYNAALCDEKWAQACAELAEFLGGTAVGFVVADPRIGRIVQCQTFGIDPSFAPKYVEYYAGKEVRLAPAIRISTGLPITERMLIDQRALERSEIYGDLLLPCDVPHFMFTWLRKTSTAFEAFALESSKRNGAFQGSAIERFRLLIPHIDRAVRIREQLLAARQSARACRSVLDSLPYGVVFLDAAGAVIELNQAAEKLFEPPSTLELTRQGVRAVDAHQDRMLQRALHGVFKSKELSGCGHTLQLPRNSGTPLTVYLVSLTNSEPLLLQRYTRAMMVLVDPDLVPSNECDRIGAALRLTQAEARLACRLFRGEDLRESAEQLGISVNTAKSQLKSIYIKTECSSHADLVRKVTMITMAPRKS